MLWSISSGLRVKPVTDSGVGSLSKAERGAAEVKDPLFRYLAILRLLPQFPNRITTRELLDRLERNGFSVNPRSAQRDLMKLSASFPIGYHPEGRSYEWGYVEGAAFSFPGITPDAALAHMLAEQHLASVLPSTVFDLLKPTFAAARDYLGGMQRNLLSGWSKRVRAIPNGKALQPAVVDAKVWHSVSKGLLHGEMLRVIYKSRSKNTEREFELHPLGIVVRHSVTYLVARVDAYDDTRQFALHRVLRAERMMRDADPDEFDIDGYIDSGAFSGIGDIRRVELAADVHPQVAWLLSESPLGDDQALSALADTDWSRLRVTVKQDQETFWWLLAMSVRIRVIEPQDWRDQLRQLAQQVSFLYHSVSADRHGS
jgi:predicted DNA-binding transcriptional regulator YafY